MSTDIAKPKSPMEEFQDNLKKSLRDDIARMLPEAALADMIKRVVEEEFFTKRHVPAPNRGSYSNETVEVPSAFQAMVVKAATPIIEREAAKLVAKLEYQIAAQIKETVEAGAAGAVLAAFTGIVNSAFVNAELKFRQDVVEMLRRNGLQINAY